jgi:cytoskeleton protein RodZ
MTEAVGTAPVSDAAASAGAMLRRAREARGLHVAALAASLKVPPKRLESLENDRWDELPDLAFARALAQSVCRALKTDPVPVLALLPRTDGNRLEQVAGGINAPFRERPGASEPGVGGMLSRPVAWVVAVLLVAAVAVLLWPQAIAPEPPLAAPGDAPGVAITELPLGSPAPGDTVPQVAPADVGAPPAAGTPPTPGDAAADAAPAAEPASLAAPAEAAPADAASTAPTLVVRAVADSWVEVRDARGQVLVSRTLPAGETLTLDAALPAQLTTGNVTGTEVRLRGEAVDLRPHQRGNIARLELK